MKKLIFVMCLCLFPITSYAEDFENKFVGEIEKRSKSFFEDPYINVYKICVDNYEYVVIDKNIGIGDIELIQSYERVVDNEGRVIALPKMCSIEEH